MTNIWDALLAFVEVAIGGGIGIWLYFRLRKGMVRGKK